MVGSELNPTQGKRGGKPPLVTHVCVASASGSIFARFFTLVPRSLFRNRTETLASAVKSPPFFSPRKFFSRALQSESLEHQATLEPSSLGSWLCSILPLPGAYIVMSSCLCLLVCLFLLAFVTFYV